MRQALTVVCISSDKIFYIDQWLGGPFLKHRLKFFDFILNSTIKISLQALCSLYSSFLLLLWELQYYENANVKNYWLRFFLSFFQAIFWCLPLKLQCCSHHGMKHFPHCLCHFKHSLSIKTNQNQEVSNCAGFDFVNTKWRIKIGAVTAKTFLKVAVTANHKKAMELKSQSLEKI